MKKERYRGSVWDNAADGDVSGVIISIGVAVAGAGLYELFKWLKHFFE